MNELHVTLPLPPSVNNLYFNLPRGGRKLSKAGEQYKRRVIALIIEKTDVMDGPEWDPDVPYYLEILIYFKALENKGWFEFHTKDEPLVFTRGLHKDEPRPNPAKKGDRKATHRFKRVDVGNFEKCLGDALSELLGVDDRANFVVRLEKDEDKDNPRALVWLREIA